MGTPGERAARAHPLARAAGADDPFAVLGLPRRWSLDLTALERRWKELSRQVHPDRHARGTPSERRLAVERAVAVNEAYRTLRDPVRRAEVLVRLLGVDPAGAQDPDLLEEAIEFGESIAASVSDAEARARLATLLERRRDEATRMLGEALDAGDGPAAGRALGRLRTYMRLLEDFAAHRHASGARS
ncbi:MAG: Fe-S protein assembly co-chaperone HscB [Myxococcota bacterium]|nr:Fe-S protein assembly co-chaperone HscB [Myxococcota bacterium]MDW8361485.1 Fe-S protein assembly co-chaperone HscB [Myxococcales bacterium]